MLCVSVVKIPTKSIHHKGATRPSRKLRKGRSTKSHEVSLNDFALFRVVWWIVMVGNLAKKTRSLEPVAEVTQRTSETDLTTGLQSELLTRRRAERLIELSLTNHWRVDLFPGPKLGQSLEHFERVLHISKWRRDLDALD